MRLFAAVLLIAFCGPVGQAQAGLSAPFVSSTYYEQNGSAECLPPSGSTQVNVCSLIFAAPPAGKAISLGGVSCKLTSGNSRISVVYIAVDQNGTIVRRQNLRAFDIGGAPRSGFYLLNEDVFDFVVTSPPRVVMNSNSPGTSLSMECQIAGTLQPA